MKIKALTVTVFLLLGISFNGMAQRTQIKLEANPQADKVENVKVERIDNQDVLRVASPSDTIRIFISDDNRSTIENLKPRIYISNKKGKVDICICPSENTLVSKLTS